MTFQLGRRQVLDRPDEVPFHVFVNVFPELTGLATHIFIAIQPTFLEYGIAGRAVIPPTSVSSLANGAHSF